MFRIHLARCFVLSGAMFVVGCNTCSDRPSMFSRFRTTSTQPAAMSSGDCNGPLLSSQPGTVIPAPQQNIPRIDENGKQMPWDPKMSRTGIKTNTVVQPPKEGS